MKPRLDEVADGISNVCFSKKSLFLVVWYNMYSLSSSKMRSVSLQSLLPSCQFGAGLRIKLGPLQ